MSLWGWEWPSPQRRFRPMAGRQWRHSRNRNPLLSRRALWRPKQRSPCVPSYAVGPADLRLSCEPSMSAALRVPDCHRRAIEGLVRALVGLQESYQVQGESLHESRVGAHQAVELSSLGQGREGRAQVSLGITIEVPLTGEARPAGKDSKGDDLALTERDASGPGLFCSGGRDWQKSSAMDTMT